MPTEDSRGNRSGRGRETSYEGIYYSKGELVFVQRLHMAHALDQSIYRVTEMTMRHTYVPFGWLSTIKSQDSSTE